ncbi:MAG: hypothetical protein V8Q65_00150 [Bacteroidaceae bacterium]
MEQTTAEGLGEMIVKGFTNFDEAHSYAQLLYNTPSVRRHFAHAKLIILSKANAEKLGTDCGIADYLNFYDKTFAAAQNQTRASAGRANGYLSVEESDLPSNAQENTESEDSDDEQQTDIPMTTTRDNNRQQMV